MKVAGANRESTFSGAARTSITGPPLRVARAVYRGRIEKDRDPFLELLCVRLGGGLFVKDCGFLRDEEHLRHGMKGRRVSLPFHVVAQRLSLTHIEGGLRGGVRHVDPRARRYATRSRLRSWLRSRNCLSVTEAPRLW